MEIDKMFLDGYSASGTFTDRFSAFHPERIKAVASGGTLDDMILPLDTYKGEKLIFPIGTYDYEEITGKKFGINKHNNLARLIYMGKDDSNNTEPYGDCYGDAERDIIVKLWGMDVLPRAIDLIDLYGKSAGKGILILDKDIKRSNSDDIYEYIIESFKVNRDSKTPVYPKPNNPEQLQVEIYE